MPDDQNTQRTNTAPTFFDPSEDSGLPIAPGTTTNTSTTPAPTINEPKTPDIESQMETPEPLYAKEHEPLHSTNNGLPAPDFSTMRKDDEESSPPSVFDRSEPAHTQAIEPEKPQMSQNETWARSQELEPPKPAPAESHITVTEEPKVIPLHAQPAKPTPKPESTIHPATLHTTNNRTGSIAALILGILLLLAIAAATFFYMQNRALTQQINTLQSTQAGREIPTPSPSPTPITTGSAVPTPNPDASPSAFTNLSNIINIARQESATAQMLMITSDNVANVNTAVYKYWFRTGPNQQQYFYIQAGLTGEPQLYTQATISPDNNIPDLIAMYETGELGIDDQAAHALAWTQVSTAVNDQTPSAVSAKFIRSRPSNPEITDAINLWQLTYTFPGRSNIIIQVNAQTSEIVYSTL